MHGFLEWESFADCAFSCSLPTCTFLDILFMYKVQETFH